MKNVKNFIDDITELFNSCKITDCITKTTQAEFLIQDDETTQRPYITFQQNSNGFRIINSSNTELFLLAVDGCLFKSDQGERCDGVILGINDVCLFELKFNTTSTRGNRKRENFKKAISQLESTIDFFKTSFHSKSKNIFDYNIEAYICMPDTSYPRDRASRNQKKVSFLEKNGVPLYDENIKEF